LVLAAASAREVVTRESGRGRYPDYMTKTSVDVDRDIARQAAAILGTTTLRDTINASLQEVVHAKRRLELVTLLSEHGRFDFDATERAWGGDG
jgi:Arc/MetJ family transcription regulator